MQVQLAQDDRSGCFQTGRSLGVFRSHVFGKDFRSRSHSHARHSEDVFEGYRYAVKRRVGIALGEFIGCRPGRGHRRISVDRNERVQPTFQLLDAPTRRLGEFNRRKLASRDKLRGFGYGEPVEVSAHAGRLDGGRKRAAGSVSP